MRGFKPKRASGANNYADGGVVSGIKRALGFDPERAARIAAYKAQQKAEAAAAPAAAPKPAGGLAQNAANALSNRRKQIDEAAGYANGGMVRGPGTGTSDDIETEIPAGSYIMPADTTRKVGAEALGELGKPVPVALSNGEYQMPPEQVHAVGVETLNQIKDATHTPVARGFNPGQAPQRDESRLFLNQGGSPSEEERRARLSQGLTPYAPNYGPAGLNPQARINAQAAAPTPAAKDPLDGGAVFGMFPQLAGGKRTTYAMDNKLRTGVQATGPSTFAQATPSEKTIIGGGDGRRMNAEQDPRSLTAVVPSGPAAPAPQTATAPAAQTSLADQRLASGTQQAPGASGVSSINTTDRSGDATMPAMDVGARGFSPVAPDALAASSQAQQVAPGVFRQGNSFGDSPQAAAWGASGTKSPNANDLAAADALANRSAQQVSAMAAQPQQPMAAGFQPAQAPEVLHSGNSWSARNALRNAQVSASSMTEQPGYGGIITRRGVVGGRPSAGPASQQYAAMLAADAKARGQEAELQGQAMRENAATGREGMREQGLNTRHSADLAARAFESRYKRGLDERRLELDEKTKGFDIRNAQRKEGVLQRYDAAKTDDERAALVKQFPDVFGKQDSKSLKDNFMAVGGGQEWDSQANVMRNVPQRLIDLRTGQEVGAPGGGRRPAQDSPQVQEIVNDTSLTKEQRAAKLRQLGYQ